MLIPKKSEVVFVEFWATPKRPLEPFEVITLDTYPAEGMRSEWQGYTFWDCAAMKDGTLIIHASGSGGIDPPFNPHICHEGQWWALKGVEVSGTEEQLQRQRRTIPRRLQHWPPENAIDAPIVECLECGFLPDDDSFWPDEDYRICPHLEWDNDNHEWVPLREKKTFRIVAEETDIAIYEIEASSEEVARERFWDLIDRRGLDDEKTEHGPIIITRVEVLAPAPGGAGQE